MMISKIDLDGWDEIAYEQSNEFGPYGTIKVKLHDNMAELHNDVTRFSKDVYNDVVCDMGDLLDSLKHEGVDTVFVYSSKLTETMKKYWRHVGFTEFKTIPYLGKEVTYSQMEVM